MLRGSPDGEPGESSLRIDHIQPTPMSRLRALLPMLYPALAILALSRLSILYGQHVAPLPVCEQLPWVRLAVAIMEVALLIPAAFLLWRGRGTLRDGQYPPPGAAVLFRRPIRRGWLARLTGIGYLLTAGVVLSAMVYLAVYFNVLALFSQPCTTTPDAALAECVRALTP